MSSLAAFLFETPTLADFAANAWPIVFCGVFSSGVAYTLKILLGDRIEYSDKRRLWLIADIMPQVFCAALYCCASILNAKEHGKETQDEDSNS